MDIEYVNEKIKSNSYDDVLAFKSEVNSDPTWLLLKSNEYNNSRDINDVTCCSSYYSENLSCSLAFVINYHKKTAFVREEQNYKTKQKTLKLK